MPRRALDVQELTRAPRVRGLARAIEIGTTVFLRAPAAGDRTEFLALRRRSRRFLAPWEPRAEPGDVDPFTRLLRARRDPRHVRLLVCARASGAIMGAVALNEIIRGPFQSCFLGYWIGREFARRGFMTEAVALIVHHAFAHVGLHRIEANIIPRNRASLALIRRAGFRREGLARRYLCIAGRWQDHEHWAMTVEDWRARGAGRHGLLAPRGKPRVD